MLFILPSISQGIALDVLWVSFDFKGDPLQFHKCSLRGSRGNWRGFAESSKGNAIEGKLKGNRKEPLLESEEIEVWSLTEIEEKTSIPRYVLCNSSESFLYWQYFSYLFFDRNISFERKKTKETKILTRIGARRTQGNWSDGFVFWFLCFLVLHVLSINNSFLKTIVLRLPSSPG